MSDRASNAPVSPLYLAMNADVALAEPPPSGAVGVVAELGERIHQVFCKDKVWRPYPRECSMDPHFSRASMIETNALEKLKT